MRIIQRTYRDPQDFEAIGSFLIARFQAGNRDGNWLQPAWEYMHSHPYLDKGALGRIGIWEDAGKIVAVAHYESALGEVFFEIHPDYGSLKPQMLAYAEVHLAGTTAQGDRYVRAFANDFDARFTAHLQGRGYQREPGFDRPISRFAIPERFPAITLPRGFRLQSLQDDNDLQRIQRVLWRGFGHQGTPPADDLAERRSMQATRNFRHDLNIVVVAPDGNFAAYCGMWLDSINRLAYVEPVATDPDYRRLGLGTAAVLEGIRRCAAEGARAAFVGSDLPFYQDLGFVKMFTSCCWVKSFAGADCGGK